MINPKADSPKPRRSFITKTENINSVWAELNHRTGGYRIFFGIKGTDVKTYAGGATSRATLDYNIRKAEVKFGLRSLDS